MNLFFRKTNYIGSLKVREQTSNRLLIFLKKFQDIWQFFKISLDFEDFLYFLRLCPIVISRTYLSWHYSNSIRKIGNFLISLTRLNKYMKNVARYRRERLFSYLISSPTWKRKKKSQTKLENPFNSKFIGNNLISKIRHNGFFCNLQKQYKSKYYYITPKKLEKYIPRVNESTKKISGLLKTCTY